MGEEVADQIIVDLASALTQAWAEHWLPKDVGSDPEKIALLLEAANAVDLTIVNIPSDLRDFSAGIFLRDIWAPE